MTEKQKKRTARLLPYLFFVLIMLVISSCGGGLFVTMPSELVGTWENSGDYVNQFQFTSNMVYYNGWSTLWPGEFDSEYECELEEVLEDESMIYTGCDIYFTYHISGSTLYLHKTNPGDPKPSLSDFWWSDSSVGKYTLYKE